MNRYRRLVDSLHQWWPIVWVGIVVFVVYETIVYYPALKDLFLR